MAKLETVLIQKGKVKKVVNKTEFEAGNYKGFKEVAEK